LGRATGSTVAGGNNDNRRDIVATGYAGNTTGVLLNHYRAGW